MTGLVAMATVVNDRGRLLYAPCIALAVIAAAAVIALLERKGRSRG